MRHQKLPPVRKPPPPMPPPRHGVHRYFFKLYALDTELDVEPGAGKDVLLQAMEGHVLDEGQLMGTYER